MGSNYTEQPSAMTEPLSDPDVQHMVSQSVLPLPNISIDELWHPASRPVSAEWEENSGEEH